MGKILCPVDGSDHAATGLAHAAALARLKGVHLTICAVNLAIGGARGPTLNQWTNEEAEALLEEASLMPFTFCDGDDPNVATATSATPFSGFSGPVIARPYRDARQAASSPATAITAMPRKPSTSGTCWNTSQPSAVAKAMCM